MTGRDQPADQMATGTKQQKKWVKAIYSGQYWSWSNIWPCTCTHAVLAAYISAITVHHKMKCTTPNVVQVHLRLPHPYHQHTYTYTSELHYGKVLEPKILFRNNSPLRTSVKLFPRKLHRCQHYADIPLLTDGVVIGRVGD